MREPQELCRLRIHGHPPRAVGDAPPPQPDGLEQGGLDRLALLFPAEFEELGQLRGELLGGQQRVLVEWVLVVWVWVCKGGGLGGNGPALSTNLPTRPTKHHPQTRHTRIGTD